LNEVSDDYLSAIYERSTALFAASEGEGFGLPLVEAARRGLPVIARDLPVFREVANGSAYFFSGLNASDVANAVKNWLALPLGERPASSAIPRLTWEQSARRLIEVVVEGASSATSLPLEQPRATLLLAS
jgi:glycosyltransferase involved in cell wall biosynthesis